ncbi:MAG: DNA primase small subunit domain-containing protein [Candidatus Thorarchaeota archaeon]
MSDIAYLKRLFKAYYNEKGSEIPPISSYERREFGYIPWEKKVFMKRHMSFKSQDRLIKHLINEGPRHIYSSGALYTQPENQDMESKGYQGCDFIIDIDVDHFYTPCKEEHDFWYCKECGKSGFGMVQKCPQCKKLKIKTLSWICDRCLETAKMEIIKLIYDFLIPDFGIDISQMRIAFSGHRGYHLKIENDQIRNLSSSERREIADYVSGENISLEILGLQERSGTFYCFSGNTYGWAKKIISKINEILKKPNSEIQKILSEKEQFNFSENYIKSFLNSKQDFIDRIRANKNFILPSIEGFAMTNWKKFFTGIVHEVGVEIDTPVTIDIHRLIRYPGSLHGKTGFKVQELFPDELDNFNPLDEVNEKLDPIVFTSEKQTTKLEILENEVPVTKIKGINYGPYKKGEIIEVPHHIAVFLLCKEVAKTI